MHRWWSRKIVPGQWGLYKLYRFRSVYMKLRHIVCILPRLRRPSRWTSYVRFVSFRAHFLVVFHHSELRYPVRRCQLFLTAAPRM